MMPKVSARKLSLITAIAMATLRISAQAPAKGRVEGTVRDASDHSPMPGVSVTFGKGVDATTDDSGHYALTVPAGVHEGVFRFIGYTDLKLPVTVPPDASAKLDAAMRASTSQLDMVVVSASKFEQRVGEVTQSLSVLPAAIIRDKNSTSLDQALDQVPGIVVIDEDPQIRAGSGFSYGAGSRVLVLMDAMPILSGDIGRPNWTFLPTENIEQVEVIKGASSVLYGSAALSGVINVRTAWPGPSPSTRAAIFGGVYDTPGNAPSKWWGESPPLTTGASFTHGQRFRKFDLVIGGNAFGDQGYVGPERVPPDTLAKDPYRLGNGGYDHRARFNFATRWRNQKLKGLMYGLSGNIMKSHSTSVFLWDNLNEGLYRPLPGTMTTTDGTQYYLDPFVAYTGPKGTRHNLRGRWFHQQFNNNNDQSNGNDLLYGEYQVQQRFDLFGETVVTAGITGQQVQSRAVLYSGGPNTDGRNTATNLAGYLQLDKKIEDRLMLSAGVRYEKFVVNELQQEEPVVRAGATWQLFQGTFLRASFGQGFRFPTIGERYIRTAVGSLHIYPNPDLQPETSVNMEGGVKQGFKIGGFTGYVDLVAFRQDFEHYVEFTFGQWGEDRSFANLLGFGFKSINTGGARITGTELEVAGKGNLGAVELRLLLGYTHTLPVSTTPDEAYAWSVSTTGTAQAVSYLSTSSYTGNDILKFRVQDLFRSDVGATYKRISGGISFRYNSHVRNIDEAFIQFEKMGVLGDIGIEEWMATHTTGDWITDVRIGYALTEQLKASFVVNNLSNEVYAIRPMSIEAPRNFQVRLAYTL